jgi:hypothetical protein
MNPAQYGGYRYHKSNTKRKQRGSKKQRGHKKRSLSNSNSIGGYTKRRHSVKSRRMRRTKRRGKIYV